METKVIRNSGARARPRAAEKRGLILRHIHRWEFTDATTIGMLLGLRRTGAYTTVSALIDRGLIASLRVSGCPTPILHLTPSGAAHVARLLAGDEYAQMPAVVLPSRVNVAHVQHDLLVQRLVTRQVLKSATRSSLSARQILFARKETGRGIPLSSPKVPDAYVIETVDGELRSTALEVQESPESDIVTERKLSQYFEAIRRKEVYGVAYASTSQARLAQVHRIWHGVLRRWMYNDEQRRWFPSHHGDVLVDDEIKKTRLGLVNIADLATHLYQHAVL